MKKNRKLIQIFLWSAGILVCAALCACSTKHTDHGQASAAGGQLEIQDNESMMTLIPDYSGMVETDSVAAAWVEQGFSLKRCRKIEGVSVLNYSHQDITRVQQSLQKDLETLLGAKIDAEHGVINAQVVAAIIAVRQKTDLLKRFSPQFDDIPSLTIEMIIIDAETKKTLCKLCHSAKNEKFARAYDAVLSDLRRFVEHNL